MEQQINKGTQRNNTSGYRGISFDKSRNKFIAHVCVKHKQVNIGRFETLTEAIEGRNAYLLNNNLVELGYKTQ